MTDDLHIFIDTSEAAYTVYTALSREESASLQEQFADHAGMKFIPLSTFRANPHAYMALGDAHDQLPEQGVIDTIMETLTTNQGAPIGLTWDGDIAVTFNDYQHAQHMYSQRDTPA